MSQREKEEVGSVRPRSTLWQFCLKKYMLLFIHKLKPSWRKRQMSPYFLCNAAVRARHQVNEKCANVCFLQPERSIIIYVWLLMTKLYSDKWKLGKLSQVNPNSIRKVFYFNLIIVWQRAVVLHYLLRLENEEISNFSMGTILGKSFPQAQVHTEFIARVTNELF